MDGVMMVAHEAARVNAQPSIGSADLAQVVEFERLMRDAQMSSPGIDQYVAKAESPMDVLTSNLQRIGGEISHNFLSKMEQTDVKMRDFDPLSPTASQQLIDLQNGVLSASFQLHFCTSLVESANRGFSTLFHMQG